MAKAKPLKERRKVWAARISKINLKILKVHHKYRNFCHHPNCKAPNECPQHEDGIHARCNKRLGVHTALFWVAKDHLNENVISQLYEARLHLKNHNLGFAYYCIGEAIKGLNRFQSKSHLFNEAGKYHADAPFWKEWNKVVISVHYSHAIPNACVELEKIRATIKRAVKGTKYANNYYFKLDAEDYEHE